MADINNLIPLGMHILSAIFTSIIAFYGFKIYFIMKEKKYLWFASGFLTITLSFLTFFITHSFNLYGASFDSILFGSIIYYGHFLYALLLIFGLLLVTLVYGKIWDHITALFIIVMITFLVSLIHTNFFKFSLLLILINSYISLKAYNHYKSSKNNNSLMTFIAFIVLTFAHIFFIISHSIWNTMSFIPYIIETLGYFLLVFMILKIK